MTLNDFVKKYQGKFVEYHSYGANSLYQCADLANQWITEGLGLTAIIGTNAYDFPSKAGNQFDYILNTPSGVPGAGDLVIFKSTDGVGHISIFVSGTSSLFTSFDQNYPLKSPCILVSHNYRNVVGWLRAKETMLDTEMVINKTVFENLVKKATQMDELAKVGVTQPQDVTKLNDIIREERNLREKAETESKGAREELAYYKAEIASKLNSTQDLARILGVIDEIIGTIDNLTIKNKTNDEKIGEYERQVTELKAEINRLNIVLKGNNTLSTATAYELLLELVSRMTSILRRN